MKEVKFGFELDQKVVVEKTGLVGIITTCAVSGNPENPEIIYYVSGATGDGWYSERLLREDL